MPKIEVKKKKIEIKVGAGKVYPALTDLEIIPSSERQEFNHEGSYGYDKVTVNPIPDNFIDPVEEIIINKNGKYNVREFAAANINVETGYFLKVEDTTLNFEEEVIVSGNEVIL